MRQEPYSLLLVLMKRLKIFFPLALLVACNNHRSSQDYLALNDFEGIDGWASVNYLTKERAHSGLFSARVDGGTEYAANYSNPLGRLSGEALTKLTVKAWVYRAAAPATANLVVELQDPAAQKNILYKGIEIAQRVKKLNEWTLVEETIELPAAANPASVLRIYLWRTGGAPVYLDDLEIGRAN